MADLRQELTYKGFTGSIEASIEDACLFGRVLFIDDLITYEGATIPELQSAFHKAVEGYLEHCRQIGKNPNKPYSGSFNVRVGPELHKLAVQQASTRGISLNQFVTQALNAEVTSAVSASHGRYTAPASVGVSVPTVVVANNALPSSFPQSGAALMAVATQNVDDMVRPYLQ